MTVKELIEKLKEMPQSATVFIPTESMLRGWDELIFVSTDIDHEVPTEVFLSNTEV
jgi:hypothetical protein